MTGTGILYWGHRESSPANCSFPPIPPRALLYIIQDLVCVWPELS